MVIIFRFRLFSPLMGGFPEYETAVKIYDMVDE